MKNERFSIRRGGNANANLSCLCVNASNARLKLVLNVTKKLVPQDAGLRIERARLHILPKAVAADCNGNIGGQWLEGPQRWIDVAIANDSYVINCEFVPKRYRDFIVFRCRPLLARLSDFSDHRIGELFG